MLTATITQLETALALQDRLFGIWNLMNYRLDKLGEMYDMHAPASMIRFQRQNLENAVVRLFGRN